MTIFVSYFTFGEDIKMYKDTGLTTISFFCMLLALLTASSTVADEIEGKTAITLLSKPINRRQFIVGKFLGIELGVLALYRRCSALCSRRASGTNTRMTCASRPAAIAESAKQWAQVMQVMPGLVLGFFEVTVLTSISVAISTRLPMLANLVVCILIFFLGHLSPVLVEVAAQGQVNELVGFMARLFAWALPSLEFFNAGPSISTGAVIPVVWLCFSGLRLLHVVQWSSAVIRVPAVRGSRPGLTEPMALVVEAWLVRLGEPGGKRGFGMVDLTVGLIGRSAAISFS